MLIWGHTSVFWLVFGVSNMWTAMGETLVSSAATMECLYIWSGCRAGAWTTEVFVWSGFQGFPECVGGSNHLKVPTGVLLHVVSGFPHNVFLVRFSGFPHNEWHLQSNITWDWIEGSVLIEATMGLMVARYCGYCTYWGIVRTLYLSCGGARERQVSYFVA